MRVIKDYRQERNLLLCPDATYVATANESQTDYDFIINPVVPDSLINLVNSGSHEKKPNSCETGCISESMSSLLVCLSLTRS